MVLRLALAERLVEALAKRQIGLVLGAGQELFHLPRARARLTGGLLRGNRGVLLRGRGRNRGCLLRVGSTEHAGQRVAHASKPEILTTAEPMATPPAVAAICAIRPGPWEGAAIGAGATAAGAACCTTGCFGAGAGAGAACIGALEPGRALRARTNPNLNIRDSRTGARINPTKEENINPNSLPAGCWRRRCASLQTSPFIRDKWISFYTGKQVPMIRMSGRFCSSSLSCRHGDHLLEHRLRTAGLRFTLHLTVTATSARERDEGNALACARKCGGSVVVVVVVLVVTFSTVAIETGHSYRGQQKPEIAADRWWARLLQADDVTAEAEAEVARVVARDLLRRDVELAAVPAGAWTERGRVLLLTVVVLVRGGRIVRWHVSVAAVVVLSWGTVRWADRFWLLRWFDRAVAGFEIGLGRFLYLLLLVLLLVVGVRWLHAGLWFDGVLLRCCRLLLLWLVLFRLLLLWLGQLRLVLFRLILLWLDQLGLVLLWLVLFRLVLLWLDQLRLVLFRLVLFRLVLLWLVLLWLVLFRLVLLWLVLLRLVLFRLVLLRLGLLRLVLFRLVLLRLGLLHEATGAAAVVVGSAPTVTRPCDSFGASECVSSSDASSRVTEAPAVVVTTGAAVDSSASVNFTVVAAVVELDDTATCSVVVGSSSTARTVVCCSVTCESDAGAWVVNCSGFGVAVTSSCSSSVTAVVVVVVEVGATTVVAAIFSGCSWSSSEESSSACRSSVCGCSTSSCSSSEVALSLSAASGAGFGTFSLSSSASCSGCAAATGVTVVDGSSLSFSVVAFTSSSFSSAIGAADVTDGSVVVFAGSSSFTGRSSSAAGKVGSSSSCTGAPVVRSSSDSFSNSGSLSSASASVRTGVAKVVVAVGSASSSSSTSSSFAGTTLSASGCSWCVSSAVAGTRAVVAAATSSSSDSSDFASSAGFSGVSSSPVSSSAGASVVCMVCSSSAPITGRLVAGARSVSNSTSSSSGVCGTSGSAAASDSGASGSGFSSSSGAVVVRAGVCSSSSSTTPSSCSGCWSSSASSASTLATVVGATELTASSAAGEVVFGSSSDSSVSSAACTTGTFTVVGSISASGAASSSSGFWSSARSGSFSASSAGASVVCCSAGITSAGVVWLTPSSPSSGNTRTCSRYFLTLFWYILSIGFRYIGLDRSLDWSTCRRHSGHFLLIIHLLRFLLVLARGFRFDAILRWNHHGRFFMLLLLLLALVIVGHGRRRWLDILFLAFVIGHRRSSRQLILFHILHRLLFDLILFVFLFALILLGCRRHLTSWRRSRCWLVAFNLLLLCLLLSVLLHRCESRRRLHLLRLPFRFLDLVVHRGRRFRFLLFRCRHLLHVRHYFVARLVVLLAGLGRWHQRRHGALCRFILLLDLIDRFERLLLLGNFRRHHRRLLAFVQRRLVDGLLLLVVTVVVLLREVETTVLFRTIDRADQIIVVRLGHLLHRDRRNRLAVLVFVQRWFHDRLAVLVLVLGEDDRIVLSRRLHRCHLHLINRLGLLQSGLLHHLRLLYFILLRSGRCSASELIAIFPLFILLNGGRRRSFRRDNSLSLRVRNRRGGGFLLGALSRTGSILHLGHDRDFNGLHRRRTFLLVAFWFFRHLLLSSRWTCSRCVLLLILLLNDIGSRRVGVFLVIASSNRRHRRHTLILYLRSGRCHAFLFNIHLTGRRLCLFILPFGKLVSLTIAIAVGAIVCSSVGSGWFVVLTGAAVVEAVLRMITSL
uniref:Uncharacterized protein n=1 Tax=Anopheles farauti TaxID=69004 RepID=A0A182PZD0_9DIPT